jgi:hypothetical protein
MLGGLFRAPNNFGRSRGSIFLRQRQCIPLSRIALRQGAAQGEIDPEGAVAAEISSSIGMLSGMLRRMPAILPRRPGRLAAFSF